MSQSEVNADPRFPALSEKRFPETPADPAGFANLIERHRKQMQISGREIGHSYELMQDVLKEIERSVHLRRRAADLRKKLYRVYLLDASGAIVAAENFTAGDDREALEVAALVSEAASDTLHGHELWHGSERITSDRDTGDIEPDRSFDDALRLHQDTIADLEERLQRGFASVNRSAKLLELTTRLRRIE